ncbi:MAG: aminoacyl-tRNA hydrolase [Candidatus Sericytochromatia bacterium]|nr:aminoacyl-tRNA hydrolase [Candidatus Sericytochromatia bacterium]
MKLIVGLGNPGSQYAETRHNVGWLVLEALASALGAPSFRSEKKFRAELSEAKVGAERILLVKPQTFMNLSGEAVGALVHFAKLAPQDVIVLYDDLSIPLGSVRIRADGSAGGHNGIKSLISHLKTQQFPRVRIGIGPQPVGMKSEQFVLARWTPTERATLPWAVDMARDASLSVLEAGLPAAMTRFNGLKPPQN